MVAFVVVGLIIVVALNTVLALVGLFNSNSCLESLIALVASGLVIAVEVMAVVLLWQLL